jgi:hypothetical protein
MDDRTKRDDKGTLYVDRRQQEQSEQDQEFDDSEDIEVIEDFGDIEDIEPHGLLHYLRMVVFGIIMAFGILFALFFGFIFLGIIGIIIFLAALFFGFLLLLGLLR